MKKYYLRRGGAIKEIPEHLIEPNIKKGKIRSSDQLSTDQKNWTPVSRHPSFKSHFIKTRTPSRSVRKDTTSSATEPQYKLDEDLPFPKPGFFQRIFALLIDSVILFTIGAILGISLKSFWLGLEEWGGYVGFIILLGYYGTLNSKVHNGQTLGKKILRIRVVGKDGRLLSLGTSFLRSTIFLLPFTLDWLLRPLESVQIAWSTFITVVSLIALLIAIGGALAIVYLYVFNQETRQSLHDVIAGTYVIRANEKFGSTLEPLNRIHLYVVSAIFILALIIPFVMLGSLGVSLGDLLEGRSQTLKSTPQDSQNIASSDAMKKLKFLHDNFGDRDDYKNVLIQIEGNSSSSKLKIEVVLKREPDSIFTALNQLDEIVKSLGPYPKNINSINLKVSFGYDIGIYKSHYHASKTYPNLM